MINKEVRIETIKDYIYSQHFTLKINDDHICIINPSGIYLFISKSIDKLNSIYYLDASLSVQYGLTDFKREWSNIEDLKKYIIDICLPQLKYIGGFTTIDEADVRKEITAILTERAIFFTFDGKYILQYKTITPSGKIINGAITHPCYTFKVKGHLYGIYLHKSFISLIELNNDFEILYEYSWFSFCPIYKVGVDYVNTTVNNFLEFINDTIVF